MPDTGNSATITFGTSAFTARFESLGELQQELEKLEISALGSSTYKEYIPGDLAEPGELDCEFQFDARAALPPLGTVELITITLPATVSGATAANFAGSGFIRRRSLPELKNNQVQKAKVLVAFDGRVNPTFTPETGGTTTTMPP